MHVKSTLDIPPNEPVVIENEPQQGGGGFFTDRRPDRIGNNRYHVPKSKARAKAKARKAAQKRNRK